MCQGAGCGVFNAFPTAPAFPRREAFLLSLSPTRPYPPHLFAQSSVALGVPLGLSSKRVLQFLQLRREGAGKAGLSEDGTNPIGPPRLGKAPLTCSTS